MEIIDKIVSSQYPPNDRNVIWENNGKLFKIINGKWREISSDGGCSTDRPSTETSLGYKVLRKDISFAEQVTEANTIYEIRDSFDLGGAEVEIPSGCTLKFNGGVILNGTIVGLLNNKYIDVRWFGAKGDGITDDTQAIKKAVELAFYAFHHHRMVKYVQFGSATYKTSSTLDIPQYIKLVSKGTTTIQCVNDVNIIKLTTRGIAPYTYTQQQESVFQGSFVLQGIGATSSCILCDYDTTQDGNPIISNIVVQGCQYGIRCKATNFWGGIFRRIKFNTAIGIAFGLEGETYASNSGENITVENCLFGNCNCCAVINASSLSIKFVNCSIDYSGLGIFVAPNVLTYRIDLLNCWLEGLGSRTDGYNGIKGLFYCNLEGGTERNYDTAFFNISNCVIWNLANNPYKGALIQGDNQSILSISNCEYHKDDTYTANKNVDNIYEVVGFKRVMVNGIVNKNNSRMLLDRKNIVANPRFANETDGIVYADESNTKDIVLSSFQKYLKNWVVDSSSLNLGEIAIVTDSNSMTWLKVKAKEFKSFNNKKCTLILKELIPISKDCQFVGSLTIKGVNESNVQYAEIVIYLFNAEMQEISHFSLVSTYGSPNYSSDYYTTIKSTTNYKIPLDACFYRIGVSITMRDFNSTKDVVPIFITNVCVNDYSLQNRFTNNTENNRIGDSNARPILSLEEKGFIYYDNNLREKIRWTGSKWVDSTGADA